MITNIYKYENQECVDICEVLYNILNQIYNFNQVIQVSEIKDIKKISNTNNSKQCTYIDISNYRGSLRTVLRKLNMEAFINISTVIVTVIPINLLKFVKENMINVEIEYIPSTLKLADIEIEIEDNLAVVTFNPYDNRGDE